jgi:spore germination protein YaaH
MRIRISLAALILAMSASAHASYRISVWQPRTDVARERVRQHAGIITETNPVFYTMTGSQGAIYESSKATNTLWTGALAGTEILPTFQNEVDFDHWGTTETANYVIHPTYRDAYTTNITNIVVSRGWAGADIDYEVVPAASKDDFTAFIQLLATKLHANGKKLSVCVYGKTNDVLDPGWEYPAGQDWTALSQYADFIKIMAYGQHSSSKPNSRFTYLNDVLNYAKSKISDHKKIIIGMPWYAQDYFAGDYDSFGSDTVQSILAANPGITPTRDTTSGEMTFSYTSGGVVHNIWYTDGPAWAAKVQYVVQNHPTIGGFAQWSVGEEDPKVWGSVAQLEPRWDFNKDGNHDIIVRNSNGDIPVGLMNGATILSSATVGSDAVYSPVAAGHFTRDGQPDIILRDTSTGDVKLWQMNGLTIGATLPVLSTGEGLWKVVGAADLDSDGRHEIIWHYPPNGAVAYWKRDVASGNWSGVWFNPLYMDATVWQMAGVGDFNLDGTDDLVWRNTSTGENRIWFTNGTANVTSVTISSATTDWKLAGVGDFNRDMYPDLLWRNESTLATVIWNMKGSTLLSMGNTSSNDALNKVVRVGDFNGDGFSDILWRHDTTGDLVLWTMNGYTATSALVFAPGPSFTATVK